MNRDNLIQSLSMVRRLALGGILLVAGVGKISAPEGFIGTVSTAFDVDVTGHPWLLAFFAIGEIWLGVEILIGANLRHALRVASLAFLGFLGFAIWMKFSGATGSCGCLGKAWAAEWEGWTVITRNSIFAFAALVPIERFLAQNNRSHPHSA